jgi:DNA-binding transcriptional MerR regulator
MSSPGSSSEVDLTIDQLAARTGMTVRNVRAYGTRGLLPPPRLVGRTGYYNGEHVARLTLVREMLDQGYTLTAAERLLAAAPTSGAQALGLYHALMTPWTQNQPEVVEAETLAAQARVAHDPAVIDALVREGLVERQPDGRLRITNPSLVRAGLEVIGLGMPLDQVMALLPDLRAHATAVAELFVELFRASGWSDFVAAGLPAEQWPRMQSLVEQIGPLAGQALMSTFQEAMGQAIETAMESDFGGPPPPGRTP